METATPAATQARAGSREWLGLAVLALPSLLLSLDMSVLFMAAPRLATALHADSTQQLWIMDIYGFMIAGFLVTMGTLGDRIGRRRLLMIGAAAFSVASIVAAFAPTADALIGARALLGIAGATQMPSIMALITNMFPNPRQRAVALSVWMSCFMGGAAIGPIIGGVLLAHFWWGSVFLMGVPVMVVLMIAGPFLLPESKAARSGRIDPSSVALSLGAILPFIYGLKEIAKNGPGFVNVAAIVAGLLIGAAFVRRQRRLADPLLDLRLFSNRGFSIALATMLVPTLFMSGAMFLASQYLQLVVGLTTTEAGVYLVPPAVSMIIMMQIAPYLMRRFHPGHLLAAGLTLGATGLYLLSRLDADSGPVALVASVAVTMIGIAPLGVVCTDLVVGSAPADRAGSAASLSETSAEFGVAMGVAAFGSIASAVYRSNIDTHIPSGTSASAAGAAHDSIAGAVETGSKPLLDAAKVAFTDGFNTVAGIGAVGMLAFAVVAVMAFRRKRQTVAETLPAATDERVLVGSGA
ncbi:MAG TPA: MFS transporter [Stackebrandtia sp.]|jgi:DHA2 family multidrug resistance protein-like MFS transporter|uniref:MFS transporter n=1 Tax=Stackebrandtia sp. TaxID=2023065 RepID=UPI002D51C804|nr:MFS transporter [Stackebrandtia sp.]HZE40263.1 MFS transporter [Stackebrandtia sp.]